MLEVMYLLALYGFTTLQRKPCLTKIQGLLQFALDCQRQALLGKTTNHPPTDHDAKALRLVVANRIRAGESVNWQLRKIVRRLRHTERCIRHQERIRRVLVVHTLGLAVCSIAGRTILQGIVGVNQNGPELMPMLVSLGLLCSFVYAGNLNIPRLWFWHTSLSASAHRWLRFVFCIPSDTTCSVGEEWDKLQMLQTRTGTDLTHQQQILVDAWAADLDAADLRARVAFTDWLPLGEILVFSLNLLIMLGSINLQVFFRLVL